MRADPINTLIKGIIGIYINRLLPASYKKIEVVVDDALDKIIMPTVIDGDGSGADSAKALKITLDWLRNAPNELTVLKKDVVSRININCTFDDFYSKIVEELLPTDEEEQCDEQLLSRLRAITQEISFELQNQKYAELFKKTQRDIKLGGEEFNIRTHAKELRRTLEDFASETEKVEKTGFTARLSTSDDDAAFAEVLEKAKDLDSDKGRLVTGLQGLNDSSGGGLRRGELINFGALTHNYKSGILLDLTRHIPMYNKPLMFDEKKKPLILRISFENNIDQDVRTIYSTMYEQQFGKELDMGKVTAEEAREFVFGQLKQNGYEVIIERYDPNKFTVWDIIDIVDYYEDQGYEIHLLDLDYLSLTARAQKGVRMDEAINYSYEIIRNHCYPKGITTATAHQLSTEAQKLSREGTSNFAATVSTGGWYQNSQSLHTKLDLEYILHIVKIGDKKYLTFYRGKHRGGEKTPLKKLGFAYEFKKLGGIHDDVLKDKSEAIYDLNVTTADMQGSGAEDIEW